MKLHNPSARVFIPGGLPPGGALKRITHLGIGAHPDDLEFMAFHGIAECHASSSKWFGGVTCTSGSGSARTGAYEKFTDAEMAAVRREEQDAAAMAGRYGLMIQLDHPASAAAGAPAAALREDLGEIIAATRPQVVYTHNLADKHGTHVGVAVAAIQAMRGLPRERRPGRVWGCEVWRGLDWLPDAEKVLMDVSGRDHLAAALNGVFDSQIAGGKRYDLAVLGRRSSNATFLEARAADRATQMIFGMDLTPLVADESRDIAEFACGFIDRFRNEVKSRLAASLGGA